MQTLQDDLLKLVHSRDFLCFQTELQEEGGGPFLGCLARWLKSTSNDGKLTISLHTSQWLQDMAWEKLHTGNWKDVPEAWRDAYTLACLLSAAARLTPTPAMMPEEKAGSTSAAIRDLDLAVMMGGPRFQRQAHDAIHALQTPSTPQPQPGGETRAGTSEKQPTKRRRTDPEDHVEPSSRIRPPAQEVSLPPDCGSKVGTWLQAQRPPSIERFWIDYMQTDQPVLFSGAMEHWPAMTKWRDMGYLAEVAGDRTVPVEVGENYLVEGWGQQLMLVSDLIKLTVAQKVDDGKARAYLAQHRLFDQIPRLKLDICEPEYCSLGEGEMHAVNAWFGPAGTVTPLHYDPPHCNLLAQVVGRKYIRLYPPSASSLLAPYQSGHHTNSSQVDLDAPDLTQWPGFTDLPFKQCILEPGQMLFIPPKHWHYVKALDVSFSVSFWWS